MAVLGFPLFDSDWFSYQIVVDGATFQFDFRYSVRGQAWYWDVFDVDGNPLQTGARIMAGVPLNYLNLFEGLPLFVRLDGNPNSPDPTRNDFPNNVAFTYGTGEDAFYPYPLNQFAIIQDVQEVGP